jgi:hypothetical protein
VVVPNEALSSSGAIVTVPMPSIKSSTASALSSELSAGGAASGGSVFVVALPGRASGTRGAGSCEESDELPLFSRELTRVSTSFSRSSIKERYLQQASAL